MVWRSVAVWQLTQPADFASASATLCRSGAGGAPREGESPSAGTIASVARKGRRNRALMSEGKQQVREDRVQRTALARVVELPEAGGGEQRRRRGVQHHVLAHERAPLHARRHVPADAS